VCCNARKECAISFVSEQRPNPGSGRQGQQPEAAEQYRMLRYMNRRQHFLGELPPVSPEVIQDMPQQGRAVSKILRRGGMAAIEFGIQRMPHWYWRVDPLQTVLAQWHLSECR
jgi:hypothetical protein